MKIRDASVTVRPTWVTIEDMDFPRLAKLSLPGIKEGIVIVNHIFLSLPFLERTFNSIDWLIKYLVFHYKYQCHMLLNLRILYNLFVIYFDKFIDFFYQSHFN